MKDAMRHIRILIPSSEHERMTSLLKDVQAVHVETEDILTNASLSDELGAIDEAIKLLKEFRENHHGSSPVSKSKTADFLDVIALLKKRASLKQTLLKRKKELNFWKVWGQAKLESLEYLQEHGLHLKLYKAKHRDVEAFSFPDGYWLFNVTEDSGVLYFLIVSKSLIKNIPFDEQKLPKRDANALKQEIDLLVGRIDRCEADITDLKDPESILNEERNRILLSQEFERVQKSFLELDKTPVSIISGWCTIDQEVIIEKELQKVVCSYQFRDPNPNDDVPVKLKNSSYNRLFEPISNIFQLPSYFEFDLTPFIAVFYPILFAYCLGDAGYGLILSLAALGFIIIKRKWNIGLLGLILGISTMIIGLIKSGSVFGIPLVTGDEWAWVNYLSQFVIIHDDTSFVWNAFNIALVIGLIQILIGLIIAIVKAWVYKGFKNSISFFGKLFIVLGSVGLFLLSNKEEAIPVLQVTFKSLLYSGIALVALFHDLSIRIIPRVAGSILPLFFIFTGLLGDVLSYVRLFALGVASAVLGLVVNQIGGQIWDAGGLYIVGALIFFLFGHSLNFALAALGSFVHPLRLTFVEFYNNAQFEGGGKPFKAFGTNSNE